MHETMVCVRKAKLLHQPETDPSIRATPPRALRQESDHLRQESPPSRRVHSPPDAAIAYSLKKLRFGPSIATASKGKT